MPKLDDYGWEDLNRNSQSNRNNMTDLLNKTGPGFCLAKWTQVTMHLGNGLTHSCHHPITHKIPLDELKTNPTALHNTSHKKERRKEMLRGERPSECDFCWRVEDNGEISDRTLKSVQPWSFSDHDIIAKSNGDENVDPRYVEVNFNRICNFACAYCSPNFSSKWDSDIRENGVYDVGETKYNWIDPNIKYYNNNEHNPYIEAFWKWFPDMVGKLHTFRITGGEPLLSKDTWKVMDYLIENPQPNLEFSINTNACPPGNQWKEFIDKVNILTEKECVKRFEIYTSAEATGNRCDYIRDGMTWSLFRSNIEDFLAGTKHTRVTVMAAFNILSLSSFTDLLVWVKTLKEQYSYNGLFDWFEAEGLHPPNIGIPHKQRKVNKIRGRMSIDIPYVRHPIFLDPGIATMDLIDKWMLPAANYMYNNLSSGDWYGNTRFEDYEALKLRRNIVDMILKAKQEPTPDIIRARKEFANFVDIYDNRRNKNFLETFPEYKDFLEMCRKYDS